MKTRFKLASLGLLLLTALSVTLYDARAVWWVDELGDCADTFVVTSNICHANATSQEQRDQCLDQTMTTYTSCITPISVPSHEPDFCYGAMMANQDCHNQAQNLDPNDPNALSFYSECRQKSGIDLCQ